MPQIQAIAPSPLSSPPPSPPPPSPPPPPVATIKNFFFLLLGKNFNYEAAKLMSNVDKKISSEKVLLFCIGKREKSV